MSDSTTERSLHVKIQFFADWLSQNITDLENVLVTLDMSNKEEYLAVSKCRCYQDILTKYEDLFEDIIYKDDDE